jgi:hypothetical protein
MDSLIGLVGLTKAKGTLVTAAIAPVTDSNNPDPQNSPITAGVVSSASPSDLEVFIETANL